MASSYKVRINFDSKFLIKHITATDEVDACWIAKGMADKFGANSFDLMHSEA